MCVCRGFLYSYRVDVYNCALSAKPCYEVHMRDYCTHGDLTELKPDKYITLTCL